MGLFLHTVLFPGGAEEECRAALGRVSEKAALSIRPEACCWQVSSKGAAVLLNFEAVDFDAAEKLSGLLDGPVMGLYIYDGDYWGYDLWKKGRRLDRFTSLPDHFGKGVLPNRAGDARMVARCFGVEPERVERYLIPWDREAMGGDIYAYGDDKAVIGDSWQMADFMETLGFNFDRFDPQGEALDEEPEKEMNRSAPTPSEMPAQGSQYSGEQRRAIDTPELPDALNSRFYALGRAELLGEAYEELFWLLRDGKYQNVLSLLTAAMENAPDEAGLYLLRAFCWKQVEGLSGRSRKMEISRDLTKALELEPDNVMALRARHPNTETSACYPRHIQDLTRLMELDPENQDLYLVERAYRHHWLKNDDAARADLEEVLDHGELWTVDLVYLCRELNLPGF